MKCNSIAQSSLVVLLLLLTVAGAHAQSETRAHVPFAFKVGTTQMPAGTYNIQNDLGPNLVMVHNVLTDTSVMAMGLRNLRLKKTNKLIFHRYGSQYFLTEIVGKKGTGDVLPRHQAREGASDRPRSNKHRQQYRDRQQVISFCQTEKRSSLRLLRFRFYMDDNDE